MTPSPAGTVIAAPWQWLTESQPAGDDGNILYAERHLFRRAENPGEANQQQGAVAPTASGSIASSDEWTQHRQQQDSSFLYWPTGRTKIVKDIRSKIRRASSNHGL